MKEVYLYLCDSKRMIADGKCSGTGCCDVPERYRCRHTANIDYAKYQKPFENRSFETVYLEDDTQIGGIISFWELDPQEMS